MTSGAPAPGEGGARGAAIAFVAGALTAGIVAFALFVFLGTKIGFGTIWEKTGVPLTSLVLDMPGALVDELTAMDAVIGNAGNPTGAREHDTMIVRPDDELGWVLRPGVSVDAYQIRAGDPVNLDPPVVYTRAGAPMSRDLRAYLDRRTVVRFTYNIDAQGFRRTLPVVDADRKLLMVGDSALFGVGVDDADTIASNLQQMLGGSIRVVNAGVAGYDGTQAFEAARKHSRTGDWEFLVYVAHNNDFYEPRHIANADKARRVIDRFESLKPRFPGGVVVALITYLQYNAEDVLGSEGWSTERIAAVDRLRRALAERCRQAGFPFVDWADIVGEVRAREKTIFAPWSLYADHAHLAPRATRLMADRIRAALSLSGGPVREGDTAG